MGNLPFATDLQLSPLANNGGPTNTHALLPGSPCIDAGENLAILPNDQRGPGFNREFGLGADIGAFEYQVQPLVPEPIVAKVFINGGSLQRSMVSSVKIEFSDNVDFPAGLSYAFQVVRTDATGPSGQVPLYFEVDGKTLTLGWIPSPFTTAGNSLIDGNYVVTVFAANVSSIAPFDGNGDGNGGDDLAIEFHCLFGDADGNGNVNASDFAAFRSVFGTGSSIFDFNGDNSTNAADFAQFRARFGTSLTP